MNEFVFAFWSVFAAVVGAIAVVVAEDCYTYMWTRRARRFWRAARAVVGSGVNVYRQDPSPRTPLRVGWLGRLLCRNRLHAWSCVREIGPRSTRWVFDPAWAGTTCPRCDKIADAGKIGLRDRFAMAALTGYIAAFAGEDVLMPEPKKAAERAYAYADACLKQRRGGS